MDEESGFVAFLLLIIGILFIFVIYFKTSENKEKAGLENKTTVQIFGSEKSSSKTKTYDYTITSE